MQSNLPENFNRWSIPRNNTHPQSWHLQAIACGWMPKDLPSG